MQYRYLFMWFIALSLVPTLDAAEAVLGVSTARLQEPQDADSEVIEEEPPPALAIPPGYLYEARGRRDPFVNPVPPPADTGPVIPEQRPLGLPGVLLNEAQLVGVVTSPEPSMNVVVVSAPGNRIFFARVGDELLDVVISEIRSDGVSFEVKPLPGSTETGQREEVVRRLSTTPGE